MKTITGEWGEAPSGGLLLQLNQYALIEAHRNAPHCYWFQFDGNGAIQPNSKIWGNDEMMPEGGKYIMTIYDALANIVFGPLSFQLCGPTPLNLNRLIQSRQAAGFNTLGIPIDNMFGQPQPGQLVLIYTCPFQVVFPPNFAAPSSVATCGTVPAAPAVYTVLVNGVAMGTISFATNGIASFNSPGFVLYPNDRLEIIAPSPMDTNLSDVAITMVGTRLT